MCALINGEVGWLMYLREPSDAGFSSRNPAYTGSQHAVISYVLSNGQVDEYPAAWAYPLATVQAAIDYFRTHGSPPPFIAWHDDGGGGLQPGPKPERS
ncbi:Imm1 family immunity protein [Paracidovorax valerianellae]